MEMIDKILDRFATPDILIRRKFFSCGKNGEILFNPDLTNGQIILEFLNAATRADKKISSVKEFVEAVIYSTEVKLLTDENEVLNAVLNGDCAVFFDDFCEVIIFAARAWEKRSITESPNETVMNGPREGFIEDLKTNLTLIERRLRSPFLAVERLALGRLSSTNIAIVYLSTVVKPELVRDIKKRLKKIDIDCVFDSYSIEPFLEQKPFSIFKQIGASEKPDVVTSKLLEGRVAIVIDGSPQVLTIPYLFVEDFHSSEDYYQRFSFSTFIRFLRYFSLITAILLPGLYVSIQIYNFNIVPMRLLITIMNAVKGTPLSPLAEMLLVILLFEIIRESSVRIPRVVAMAMSIVGALVLGDTAVKAGLLSSPSILIAALSSIALFTVPQQIGTMTLLRLIFTLIGGIAGIYGLIMGCVFVIHYLAGLDNYNAPYLAPFAPFIPADQKDGLVKRSMLSMKKRPESISNINKTRQASDGE